MTGTTILLAAPIIVLIGGFFAEKYANRLLSCIFCGIITFFVFAFRSGGGDIDGISSLYAAVPEISYAGLSNIDGSYGSVLLIKLISILIPDVGGFLLLTSAVNAVGISVLLYRRSSVSCIGASVYTACFMLPLLMSFGTYTAALITAFSFRYLEEQRFFRFMGLVLLAACFDMSALLIIPVFFLSLIRIPPITAVIAAATAVLLIVFPTAGDTLFGFIGTEGSAEALLPLPAVIVIAAVALFCTLIFRMLGTRRKIHISAINAMLFGTAFSVVSMYDGRYFPISLFLLLPTALSLLPDAMKITETLISKTFGEHKTPALAVYYTLCAAIGIGISVFFAYFDTFNTASYTLSF